MADNSKIEWTEATWNPITGCSVASPGCTNCYAMRLAGTRLQHHPSRAGLTKPTKAGPVWTGEVRFNEQWLDQPLRWKRPRIIFVCAHADLFHADVPDEWIDQIFAVMALCPQHTFQVLTKRSDRMRAYLSRASGRIADAVMALRHKMGIKSAIAPLPHITPGTDWWPLANVWLGVSAEDQTRADERIPDLLATPAAVRWISAEPLLGPISLCDLSYPDSDHRRLDGLVGLDSKGCAFADDADHITAQVDWVVVGAESGPGARPMVNGWAEDIVADCLTAGVAVFVKQLSGGGPKAIKDIDQFPPALQVREYPK